VISYYIIFFKDLSNFAIYAGAPFENYRFSDADVAEDIKSGKLWNMLELYDSEGSLISASTPGEDVWTEFGKKPGKEVTTGLVAGHAYTIIKVGHTTLNSSTFNDDGSCSCQTNIPIRSSVRSMGQES